MVPGKKSVRVLLLTLLLCVCTACTAALSGCHREGSHAAASDAVVVAVKRNQNATEKQREQEAALRAYVEAFHAVYPDIEIEIQYMNELPVQTDGIDCMLMGADDMLAYVTGQLADLAPYYATCGVDTDELLANAVELGRFGDDRDAIYFQAIQYDRACIYANTEIFAAMGVELPDADWDYSTFLTVLQALTGHVERDRYCGIYIPYFMPYAWRYYCEMFSDGWTDGKEVRMDQEDVHEAMLTLLNLYEEGWARSYNRGTAGSNVQCAMSWTFAAEPNKAGLSTENDVMRMINPGANAEALLAQGKLKLLPLPSADDGRRYGTINTDFVHGFAVTENSSKKEEAAKFALFAVTDAGQRALIPYFGGIPVRKALWEDDFWKTGFFAGENADAVLIGIEADQRDDYCTLLEDNPDIYMRNIRIRTVWNSYMIRQYSEDGKGSDGYGAGSRDRFLQMLDRFTSAANRAISGHVPSAL